MFSILIDVLAFPSFFPSFLCFVLFCLFVYCLFFFIPLALQEFAKLMFEHCEALRPLTGKYNELFEHFRSWKGTIPTAGTSGGFRREVLDC